MQTFWTVIYIVGLVSFYTLVIFIIPLGARDLRRLFRELSNSAGGDGAQIANGMTSGLRNRKKQ